MQTFLPFPDLKRSARCLDMKRLGKQRVECKQIFNALTVPGYGWSNHPAVRMWTGHASGVALYGAECCRAWIERGYRNSLLEWFLERIDDPAMPRWFGDPVFHRSHQSNLVRKLPEHYRKYFPDVSDDLPYAWPSPNLVSETMQ